MSNSTTWKLEVMRQVDEACRKFEREFRAGGQPSIEGFLASAEIEVRCALFPELLALEVELRQAKGNGVDLDAYRLRFPEYSDLVQQVFHEATLQEEPGPTIPGYRILRPLGRGGMGVVFLAEETALNRLVAIKTLPPGVQGDCQRRRFEREAGAAARLHHTSIVPVFRVGEFQGTSFYVMQYIRGVGLDVLIKRGRQRQANVESWSSATPQPLAPGDDSAGWSVPALGSLAHARWVARIGTQAAEALDHAHQHGVIHRDIKPSNLLLDDHGAAWVTDFGLAKVEGHDNLTNTGDILGTLRYMPPETFNGTADARSDIYALGLTLYELLTLQPAYRARDNQQLIAQIMTEEPARLSQIEPRLPRDLVTVVQKAMEREPRHRYATAGELASDLHRFLNDEPVSARPLNSREKLWRWVNRHRAIAALALTVLLSLLTVTVLSTYFGLDAAARAEREKGLAREASLARRQSDRQAARLAFKEAVRQAQSGAVDVGLFGLIEALRLSPQDDHEFRSGLRLNFAAWSACLPLLRWAVLFENRGRDHVWIRPLGPDGDRYVAWQTGQPVRIFETTSGHASRSLKGLDPGEVPLTLDAKGTLLLTRQSLGKKMFLRLRSLATGEAMAEPVPVDPLEPRQAMPWLESSVLSARYAMTGGLPSAPWGGPRRFWDMTASRAHPLTVSAEDCSGFHCLHSLDHKGIAAAFHHGEAENLNRPVELSLWDVERGNRIDKPIQLLPGSPYLTWDGRTLLTISGDVTRGDNTPDGSVCWWDVATCRLLERWQPRRRAWHSTLTADGGSIVAYGEDERVRLLDLDTGFLRAELHLSGHRVHGQAIPDATAGQPILLTHSSEGVLRAWDTGCLPLQAPESSSPRSRAPTRPMPHYRLAAISPNGRYAILTLGDSQDYGRLVEVPTGQTIGPPLRQSYLQLVAFSPDSRLVAFAPQNLSRGIGTSVVTVLDTATGRASHPAVAFTNTLHSLKFSPDGQTLAVAGLGRTTLIDTATGRARAQLLERSFAADLAFSPDGTILAIGYRAGWPGVGGGIRLWDPIHGSPRSDFKPLENPDALPRLHWQENGKTLLVSDFHHPALLRYDVSTGAMVLTKTPPGSIGLVAARPNDTTAAIAYAGGTVVSWDFALGQAVGEPMVHPASVQAMGYSSDGRILAVTARNHAVYLWDTATGLSLGPPLLHSAAVLAAAFSPDGRQLITATTRGTVRCWPMPQTVPDDPAQLLHWVQAASGRVPAAEGTSLLSPEAWVAACRELDATWPEAGRQLARRREMPIAAAWHAVRAQDAEARGNEYTALWHLERLAKLWPANPQVAIRRGSILAAIGEYDAAATALKGAPAEILEHGAALARNLGQADLARWYASQR